MLTKEDVENTAWFGDQRKQVLELIAAVEKAKGEGYVEAFNTWRAVLVEHDIFIGDEPIPTRQHVDEAFKAHDGRVEVTVLNAAIKANLEAFPNNVRSSLQTALDGAESALHDMDAAIHCPMTHAAVKSAADTLRTLDTSIMRRTLELLRPEGETP